MPRVLNSWLKGFAKLAEDTEAPRKFWLWAGISTIASALQRKVWLPFGMETYYPNLFVIIAGPPASRKALPIKKSKEFLSKLEIPTAKDSGSKRDYTKALAETQKTEAFEFQNQLKTQCALSIISMEMSSLLAVNPKEMIEVLTDLYDCPDKWDYGTTQRGDDFLYNVCLNTLIATTPSWMMRNLPPEAIGEGFTSRFALVYADTVYKRIAWPELSSTARKLQDYLVGDLLHISRLVGEFKVSPEAKDLFSGWYHNIDSKIKSTRDERLHPFIGRMHAMVLKVAMVLRVDHTDELLIEPPEIERAIEYLEEILATASGAFGSLGSTKTGINVMRILIQLKTLGKSSFQELLATNLQYLTKFDLEQVLETLEATHAIKTFIVDGEKYCEWTGMSGVGLG